MFFAFHYQCGCLYMAASVTSIFLGMFSLKEYCQWKGKPETVERFRCFKPPGVQAAQSSVDLTSKLPQPCLSSVFRLSLRPVKLPNTSQFSLIYSEWVLNGTLFHFGDIVRSHQFCMRLLSHLSASHTANWPFSCTCCCACAW